MPDTSLLLGVINSLSILITLACIHYHSKIQDLHAKRLDDFELILKDLCNRVFPPNPPSP